MVGEGRKWASWGGLFKKLAVGAAAIASAPFVAPPLLLFSALTLVLSFPFALFLAGVACVHNFITSLLSLPQQHQEINYTHEELEESAKEEEEEEEKKHDLKVDQGRRNDHETREVESGTSKREIDVVEIARKEEPAAEPEGEAAAEKKENKEEMKADDQQVKSKKGKSKKATSAAGSRK